MHDWCYFLVVSTSYAVSYERFDSCSADDQLQASLKVEPILNEAAAAAAAAADAANAAASTVSSACMVWYAACVRIPTRVQTWQVSRVGQIFNVAHHVIGCRRPWHGLRCCRHKRCVSSDSRRIRIVSDHLCIHVTAWSHLCDATVIALMSNGTCILHRFLIPALLHHLPYPDRIIDLAGCSRPG